MHQEVLTNQIIGIWTWAEGGLEGFGIIPLRSQCKYYWHFLPIIFATFKVDPH